MLVNIGVRNIGNVSVNHVVDGHHNRVVKKIWLIIAHIQLSSLLKSRVIIDEIDFSNHANMSRYGQNKICCKIASGETKVCDRLANNCDGDLKTIFIWFQVVCLSFDINMDNFTS